MAHMSAEALIRGNIIAHNVERIAALTLMVAAFALSHTDPASAESTNTVPKATISLIDRLASPDLVRAAMDPQFTDDGYRLPDENAPVGASMRSLIKDIISPFAEYKKDHPDKPPLVPLPELKFDEKNPDDMLRKQYYDSCLSGSRAAPLGETGSIETFRVNDNTVGAHIDMIDECFDDNGTVKRTRTVLIGTEYRRGKMTDFKESTTKPGIAVEYYIPTDIEYGRSDYIEFESEQSCKEDSTLEVRYKLLSVVFPHNLPVKKYKAREDEDSIPIIYCPNRKKPVIKLSLGSMPKSVLQLPK